MREDIDLGEDKEKYEITIMPQVKKKLKSKRYRHRQDEFDAKVEKIQKGPKSYGKPLSGPLKGKWEIYMGRGDRIYYKILEKENKIKIYDLAPKP